MATNFKVHQVEVGNDLAAICAQIQPDRWGKDNEMTSYQPASLLRYLEAGGILLLVLDGEKITGVALCYELLHPAGLTEDSLYIHELDTHPDYRRHGISTLLVNEAKRIAAARGLAEVWVGTEQTNSVADSFYRHLAPSEIEPSYIYAYKTDRK